MNYSRAIKLLFDVENPDLTKFGTENDKLEQAAIMAHRKFRIITSMQRLSILLPRKKHRILVTSLS